MFINALLVVCCGLLAVFTLGMFSPKEPIALRSAPVRRPPLVDQVVLILVDALRPDFALKPLAPYGQPPSAPLSSDRMSTSTYASATLTYIEEALTGGGSTSRPALGAFFVADAPTTTAQRLKALTTGVVPALVEAGRNFASDAVVEDSIISQLNGSCVVLGDDTWLSLYPMSSPEYMSSPPVAAATWMEAEVFPSFQVDDLDTNDDGVLKALQTTLDESWRRKAKLVLAHFLGVDHAGHTFYANHTAMHRKLAQLNVMLRQLAQYLSQRAADAPGSRTLLMVLGDHGMTNSGDHGGSSAIETDSFFFAELFSSHDAVGSARHDTHGDSNGVSHLVKKRWARCSTNDLDDTCRLMPYRSLFEHHQPIESPHVTPLSAFRQVDLVPTLSLLLGVAIPFSNSGRAVGEVLQLAVDGAGTIFESEMFMRENCVQLQGMLKVSSLDGDADVRRVCGEGVDVCGTLVHGEALEHCLATMSSAVRRAALHIRWTVVLWSLAGAGALFLVALALQLRSLGVPQGRRCAAATPHLAAQLALPSVVTVGACIVHFSNSFVVYEAQIVTSLLTFLLAMIAWRERHLSTRGESVWLCRSLVVVALCVRCVFPDGWRRRSHGTHHLADVRALEDDVLRWTGLPTAVVLLALMVLSWWGRGKCAGLWAPVQHNRRRSGLFGHYELVVVVLLWMQRCVGPHSCLVVVLASGACVRVLCAVSRSLHRHSVAFLWRRNCAVVSYACVVLWLSGLCDPSHPVWCMHVCVFGVVVVLLRFVVDASLQNRMPRTNYDTFLWSLTLFLLASSAYFAHGQQNTFTAIDWTASTVGEGDLLVGYLQLHQRLWWKGFLVLARTYGTSILPVVALALPAEMSRSTTTTWRGVRQYYVLLWVCKGICAAVAALVLREHLMVVAIFGPNVIFCTLHAALVAGVSALVELHLRAFGG